MRTREDIGLSESRIAESAFSNTATLQRVLNAIRKRRDEKLFIDKHRLLTDDKHIVRLQHGERSWAYRKAAFKAALSVQHAGILLDTFFGISHLLAPTVMIPELNFLNSAELVYAEAATVTSGALAASVHWRLNSGRANKYQIAKRLNNDAEQAGISQLTTGYSNRKQALKAKKRLQKKHTKIDALSFALGITDFVTKHFFSTHAATSLASVSGPAAGFYMAARQLWKAKQAYQQAQQAEQNARIEYMWLNHFDKLQMAEVQLHHAQTNQLDGEALKWLAKVRQYRAQLDAIYHVIDKEHADTDKLTADLQPEQLFHFNASFKSYQPQCNAYKPLLHGAIVNNLRTKNLDKASRLKWNAGYKTAIAIGFCFLAASALPGVGHVVAIIGLSIVATAGIVQAASAISKWNNNLITSNEELKIKTYQPHPLKTFKIPAAINRLMQTLNRSNSGEHVTLGDTDEQKRLAMAYYYHRMLEPCPIDPKDKAEQHKFQRFFDMLQSMPKDQQQRFFSDIEDHHRQDQILIQHAFKRQSFDTTNPDHTSYLQSLSKKQRTTTLKTAIKSEEAWRRKLHKKQQELARSNQSRSPRKRRSPATYVKLGSNPWLACQP